MVPINLRIKGGIQESFASVLQAYKSSDDYNVFFQGSSVALQDRLLARRRRDQRVSSADDVRADARIKRGTQPILADVLPPNKSPDDYNILQAVLAE